MFFEAKIGPLEKILNDNSFSNINTLPPASLIIKHMGEWSQGVTLPWKIKSTSLFANIKVSTPALPIKHLLNWELNFSKIIFLFVSGIPLVPPVAKLIKSLLIFKVLILSVFRSKIFD